MPNSLDGYARGSATGKTGTCRYCAQPIYELRYNFGGKDFMRWKHEADKGKPDKRYHETIPEPK